MLKAGIIGYGTIGAEVASAIVQGKAGALTLASILVRKKPSADQAFESFEDRFTESEEQFFAAGLDVVVECAGHDALHRFGAQVLEHGADLVTVSVGAFADEALYERLRTKAKQTGQKIYVPSAAIGGLDRIAAGSVGPMEEVTLITRKPPKAWYGTRIEQQVDLAGLSEPFCAFEGAARDSARLFPESVNVSAALSLAGIGFDLTKVKVFVDPHITRNTHEIEARGKFGQIRLQIENTPSERNPKTGYIVAMSVVKTLRDLTGEFVIGI